MKLSKAQQEVVDKMRDGYYIGIIQTQFTICVLMKPLYPAIIIDYGTLHDLLHVGAIELSPVCDQIYRLTEQYKTPPDSVTGQ